MNEKAKKFVKKHKVGLSFVGGAVVGITVGSIMMYRSGKDVKEILPEWAEKWREHCNKHNLLYDNGLPIFANEEQTKIFRDAFAPEADIEDYISMGYEIVERT